MEATRTQCSPVYNAMSMKVLKRQNNFWSVKPKHLIEIPRKQQILEILKMTVELGIKFLVKSYLLWSFFVEFSFFLYVKQQITTINVLHHKKQPILKIWKNQHHQQSFQHTQVLYIHWTSLSLCDSLACASNIL